MSCLKKATVIACEVIVSWNYILINIKATLIHLQGAHAFSEMKIRPL